VYNLT